MDRMLSSQLRAILHDADFQGLEAKLATCIIRDDSSSRDRPSPHIRVLNVGKRELLHDLEESPFEQSALYKKLYDDEFCQLGGSLMACW